MPSSFTLPATMPEKARRRFAASVCGGWPAMQVQRRHRGVVGLEGTLEFRRHAQRPVEEEGVARGQALLAHLAHALDHGRGDQRRSSTMMR
jgi:hypothetical protein